MNMTRAGAVVIAPCRGTHVLMVMMLPVLLALVTILMMMQQRCCSAHRCGKRDAHHKQQC